MSDTTLTLADRLNALTDAHGGYWTRQKTSDGTDTLRLFLPAGDVIAGRGATTADAVTNLEAKVAQYVATFQEA